MDGNKRLGWLATAIFLELNDASVRAAANDDVYDLVMSVASSDIGVEEIAAAQWLRLRVSLFARCRRRPGDQTMLHGQPTPRPKEKDPVRSGVQKPGAHDCIRPRPTNRIRQTPATLQRQSGHSKL